MRLSFDRNYVRHDVVNPSLNTPAVTSNKLEALKLVAEVILAEVHALERARNLAESDNIDLAREVELFETEVIRCALVRTRGRQRKAARLLNIKPTTLHAKLKRFGILQDQAKEDEKEEDFTGLAN